MATPVRISAGEARDLLESDSPPLLVCGYDDEKAFRSAALPTAIFHPDFLKRVPSLPRTHELIFYCG